MLKVEIFDTSDVSHDVVALKYFDLLSLEIEGSDDDSYGVATMTLQALGGGSFVPVDHMEVWIHEVSPTTGYTTYRYFGGHICDMTEEPDGNEQVWSVSLRDYSEELDALVLEDMRGTTAGYSFESQVTEMVNKVQYTGGTATIAIDANSDVIDLTPGYTYPHRSWPAGTSLRTILQDLCNAAQANIASLRPRFRIGLTRLGTSFGVPLLSVWDAASQPTPAIKFSTRGVDILAGTHKRVYGPFKRKLDGTQLTTRVPAWGADGLYSVQEDTVAKARYRNRYSATNAWSVEAIEDTSLTTQADVDAFAKRYLGARAYSRESVEFYTFEPVYPGMYVSLTNPFSGVSDYVYPVADVRITWESPLKPKYTFTLGARLLEPGDRDEGALAAPAEGYAIQPDPPTSLTAAPLLADGTYGQFNISTGQTEVVLTWTPSTSGDIREYKVFITYPDPGGKPYIFSTTGTGIALNIPPGTPFRAFVQAYSLKGRYSDYSNVVTETSAYAITDALFNASFDQVNPHISPPLPLGWKRFENYGGTCDWQTPTSAFFLRTGQHSIRLRSLATSGSESGLTSTMFRISTGTSYELNVPARQETGYFNSNLQAILKYYDKDVTYLSGQDTVISVFNDPNAFPDNTYAFTPPANATLATLTIRHWWASGAGAGSIYIDDLSIERLATVARAGSLSTANATKLNQFQPTASKTLSVAKSVTLDAASDGLTLTIPGSGTVALLGASNVFTAGSLGLSPATGAATITVSSTSSTATMVLSGPAGQTRELAFRTGATNRWRWLASATAEGGSNAGSDFILAAVGDGGAAIGNALLITRSTLAMTFGGDVTMTDAKNIIVSATTGTKIGTATSQRLGFYGATPVPRPGAYTQTYATADKTLGAYTSDPESSAYAGITSGVAGTPYAQLTDLNALRTAYENLRAFVDDLAGVVNSHTDDLQALGLVG